MKIVIVFLSMTLGMSCDMCAMRGSSRKQIKVNVARAAEKARARKNSTSTPPQSPRTSPHTLSAAVPTWSPIDGTIIPSQNTQNK